MLPYCVLFETSARVRARSSTTSLRYVMHAAPPVRRFSFFARGVCVAAPRRHALNFWIHAHSPRGHGVHSPLLYSLCREVFFVLFRQRKTNVSARTQTLVGLLREWWERNPTRASQHVHQDILVIEDTAQLKSISQKFQAESLTDLPAIILVRQPRIDAARWNAWVATYHALARGVVIDLYTWGLIFLVKDIALHKFAVRGFICG